MGATPGEAEDAIGKLGNSSDQGQAYLNLLPTRAAEPTSDGFCSIAALQERLSCYRLKLGNPTDQAP